MCHHWPIFSNLIKWDALEAVHKVSMNVNQGLIVNHVILSQVMHNLCNFPFYIIVPMFSRSVLHLQELKQLHCFKVNNNMTLFQKQKRNKNYKNFLFLSSTKSPKRTTFATMSILQLKKRCSFFACCESKDI